MISRVATAVLAVADQDAMADFFVQRLGFVKVVDAEMWPGARWVEVAPPVGGTNVVLSAAENFGRDPDLAYPMTFACDDLPATAAQLRATGVEVTGPVAESWGSYIQVTDPEGRQLLVNDRV